MRGMSHLRIRPLSNALLILGLALGGYGASLLGGHSYPVVEGGTISPSGVVVSLGKIRGAPLDDLSPSITLKNGSPRPLQVLGMQYSCTLSACMKADNLPVTIPGHRTGIVKLKLFARAPGDFEGSSVLYTDSPEAPEIRLTVRGVLIPPKPSKR